jgi:hypothetical protein
VRWFFFAVSVSVAVGWQVWLLHSSHSSCLSIKLGSVSDDFDRQFVPFDGFFVGNYILLNNYINGVNKKFPIMIL